MGYRCGLNIMLLCCIVHNELRVTLLLSLFIKTCPNHTSYSYEYKNEIINRPLFTGGICGPEQRKHDALYVAEAEVELIPYRYLSCCSSCSSKILKLRPFISDWDAIRQKEFFKVQD